jgi:hypothetical protein
MRYGLKPGVMRPKTLILLRLELLDEQPLLTRIRKMLTGGMRRAHSGSITTYLGVRAIRIGRFGKPLKGLEQSK